MTNDMTTLKYDSEGNVVWLRNYTETDITHEEALSPAIDAGGTVYISGGWNPTSDPEGPLQVPLTLTYDVRAFNAVGDSGYSNPASATTPR